MQKQTDKPTHEEIAEAAYRVYLERGAVGGQDTENWLRAEQLLTDARRTAKSPFREDSTDSHIPPSTNHVLQPLDQTNHPNARDQRGSPDRTDIRRKTTPFRPASRQTRPSR